VTIAFRGGQVVGMKEVATVDVLIDNDVIVKVGANLDGDVNIDATGCHIFPGFVDLHAHLREPGREDIETIETASRAGAKGGYTALIAMPNTNPAHDSVTVIEFVREQAKRAGILDVFPSGCITMGRNGEALAPFAELSAAGVRIFTDDGSGVQDPVLMGRAMQYAKSLGVTMAQHCEVSALTQGAVMNECGCSSDMGVPGWPAHAEEMMVQRDIEMSRITGASVHFLHLSTSRSVELVRQAKAEGLNVTAEVTPHHLSLTHELLTTFDPIYKVNPPLRSMNDIEALKVGLLDGTIDAVATDHAPHARRDKELTLDLAPPGMIGLETALGVVLSAIDLDPIQIAAVMSRKPARIAQISPAHGHSVKVGDTANLCVVDLDALWKVNPSTLASKSKNTPFVGRQLRGMVRNTMYRGQITVRDGEAQK